MKKFYLLVVFFLLTSVSCGSNYFDFNLYKSKREKILEDFAKGYIYLAYNQTNKGIKYLEEGNKYLNDPYVDLYIAKIYLKKGKLDKALDIALKAYKRSKDPRIAHFILMIYIQKKDFDNLIKFAIKAYQDNPDDKVLFHILSVSLDPIKLFKMAQALENKDIKKSAFFYKLAGDIFLNNGKKAAAALAYYNAGLNYVYLSNYKEAIKLFKKAYELNKNNIEYINSLAYTYLLLGNIKEAERYIKKLEKMDYQDNPSVLDTLAYYYYKIGDYKKALNFQKKAIKNNGSSAILYAHLSLIYNALGDKKNAKEYAKIALNMIKIDPSQALGEEKTIKEIKKILKEE